MVFFVMLFLFLALRVFFREDSRRSEAFAHFVSKRGMSPACPARNAAPAS